jgi:hypothetical protein
MRHEACDWPTLARLPPYLLHRSMIYGERPSALVSVWLRISLRVIPFPQKQPACLKRPSHPDQAVLLMLSGEPKGGRWVYEGTICVGLQFIRNRNRWSRFGQHAKFSPFGFPLKHVKRFWYFIVILIACFRELSSVCISQTHLRQYPLIDKILDGRHIPQSVLSRKTYFIEEKINIID